MHEACGSNVEEVTNLLFASDKFAQEQLGLSKAIGEVDMDKFNVLGGSGLTWTPFAATGAENGDSNIT